jgi:hypothetical protein
VRRTRSTRLFLLTALLAAVATVPASALAAPPRCEQKAGDTLLRTSQVRVFQRSRGTVSAGKTVWLYSCRPGSRRVTRVDRWRSDLDADLRIRSAHLGGTRRLVLGIYEATGTNDTFVLRAYDLTTARRTFTFAVDDVSRLPFVVTAGGGIALLEESGLVRAFDGAGARVLEPSGATDLAASGNRAYWTAAGAARSAVLSGHPTSS